VDQPWVYIAALGAAIFGFAWMMPKIAAGGSKQEFVSEEAYNQLLEDLEAENRELLDAVAKFKREHDGTVEKLGHRIVELEQQMKTLSDLPRIAASPAEPPPSASPLLSISVQGSEMSGHSEEAQKNAVISQASPPISEPVDRDEPASSAPGATPSTIRDRYAEVLGMDEKGKSVEQIAKATGMNKGEVQLILQLARREERQHA